MRIPLFGLVVLLIGCATDEVPLSESHQASDSVTIPTRSGDFQGHYVVPASPDLADAAKFDMAEVEWTVLGGVATLHYDLPVRLVGGDVEVTLSGPIASGATSVQLSGLNGSGRCTAQGTKVTCTESLANLGTLPVSMTVVQQTAVADSISVSSATSVANFFSTDPIGTVDFDVSKPSVDDSSGGGDSDDGGHSGPH
jgi:hypothetical protein